MGRKKKHKFTSDSYRTPQQSVIGSVEYCCQVLVMGEVKITPKAVESAKGDSFEEKIRSIIRDKITTTIPSSKYTTDIKFRIPTSSTAAIDEIYKRETQRLETEKEKGVEYYGQVISKPVKGGEMTKKLAVFKFEDLEAAWKEQRLIWNSWKEFLPIFLDDHGVEFELETEDSEGVTLDEESELKKKLLQLFPEDSERLGYLKLEKQ